MPWWCDNCARRMNGRQCKCGVNVGAERIPPLDGWVVFGEDDTNQGTPRYILMQQREEED